jgi:hypothetical protein
MRSRIMSQPAQQHGVDAEDEKQPDGRDQIDDVVHGEASRKRGADV